MAPIRVVEDGLFFNECKAAMMRPEVSVHAGDDHIPQVWMLSCIQDRWADG